LRDDAAERVADDVGSFDTESVEQKFDVVCEVEPAVTALRLARLSVAANVDENQAKVLR